MNPIQVCLVVLFLLSVQCSLVGVTSNASIVKRPGDLIFQPLTINDEWKKDFYNSLHEIIVSKSMCLPFHSCGDRCGQVNVGLPFTCSCDKFCSVFSDCCIDFEKTCSNLLPNTTTLEDSSTKVTPVCTELDLFQWPVYIIKSCALSWNSTKYLRDSLSPKYVKFCQTLCKDKRCNKDILLRECKDTIKRECEGTSNGKVNELDLVEGAHHFLYANSACAMCNGQVDYWNLNITILKSDKPHRAIRSCFPSSEKCTYGEARLQNQSLDHLCKKYSGPLVGATSSTSGEVVYHKNIYCALCNGENISELRCPSWTRNQSITFLSLPPAFTFGEDSQGIFQNNLPAAFSILLNFGLDGQQRMAFSSVDVIEMKQHQQSCPLNHIWDPFSEVCRELYCSTEYILVDFKCIRKPLEVGPTEDDNKQPDNVKAELDFVHLTLTVQMELLDVLKYYGKENNVTEMFACSISKRFNINLERIKNVKINITLENVTDANSFDVLSGEVDEHSIIFYIDFDLYEPAEDEEISELPVDNIVSMMTSSISEEQLSVFESAKGKVLEIQQAIDPLRVWCNNKRGSFKRVYWNSEFDLIMNDNGYSNSIKEVYIEKEDKRYPKGEFVAYILYQISDLKDDLINVSRLVIVCDIPKLIDSCIRIKLAPTEYSILSNGSLRLLNDSAYPAIKLDKYEILENDSVLVCLNASYSTRYYTVYFVEMDIVQAYVSLISLCISIVALTVVLMTYTLFSSLRNLPGCNTMNLTFSLLVMEVTFLVSQRESVTDVWCRSAAKLLHYEILCSLVWMNVMAYDLYKTFGDKSGITSIRSKTKYLLKYACYAYGSPCIIIVVGILLDQYDVNGVVTPRYGHGDKCWITNKYGAIVFFACPLAIIMVVNFVLYFMTISSMRALKQVVSLVEANHQQPGWKDVMLYARMAFVTGLTWVLSFIAAYMSSNETIGQIIIYLFIVFNTLQGLFIFFVFVCNRRVATLYVSLLKSSFQNTKDFKGTRIFQHITVQITRTVSSETTISNISERSDGKRSLDDASGMTK